MIGSYQFIHQYTISMLSFYLAISFCFYRFIMDSIFLFLLQFKNLNLISSLFFWLFLIFSTRSMGHFLVKHYSMYLPTASNLWMWPLDYNFPFWSWSFCAPGFSVQAWRIYLQKNQIKLFVNISSNINLRDSFEQSISTLWRSTSFY